jgi:hypothetical protein
MLSRLATLAHEKVVRLATAGVLVVPDGRRQRVAQVAEQPRAVERRANVHGALYPPAERVEPVADHTADDDDGVPLRVGHPGHLPADVAETAPHG